MAHFYKTKEWDGQPSVLEVEKYTTKLPLPQRMELVKNWL